jgi:hypothetical protein
MLSYIYRIASEFQKEHGYPPNTLFLNRQHLTRLKLEFAGVRIEKMLDLLAMEIRVEQESGHPHVGWFDTAKQAMS